MCKCIRRLCKQMKCTEPLNSNNGAATKKCLLNSLQFIQIRQRTRILPTLYGAPRIHTGKKNTYSLTALTTAVSDCISLCSTWKFYELKYIFEVHAIKICDLKRAYLSHWMNHIQRKEKSHTLTNCHTTFPILQITIHDSLYSSILNWLFFLIKSRMSIFIIYWRFAGTRFFWICSSGFSMCTQAERRTAIYFPLKPSEYGKEFAIFPFLLFFFSWKVVCCRFSFRSR